MDVCKVGTGDFAGHGFFHDGAVGLKGFLVIVPNLIGTEIFRAKEAVTDQIVLSTKQLIIIQPGGTDIHALTALVRADRTPKTI